MRAQKFQHRDKLNMICEAACSKDEVCKHKHMDARKHLLWTRHGLTCIAVHFLLVYAR